MSSDSSDKLNFHAFLQVFPSVDSPSLTTAKLDKASGTLTPAATNVRPITVSGIPNVLPEKRKFEKLNT